MRMRNLDTDNDWEFGNSQSNYVTATQAIALDVKTALQGWVGDCFFALQDGIDWYNRLEFNQKQNLDNDISNLILSRNGIIGIISFSSYLVNRVYTAYYTVQTIYSTTFTDNLQIGS